MKIAQYPYVTKELFLEYPRNVVIPSIENNWELLRCQGKPTIIFCANCSCCCSDDILQELANYAIILITYPPHTSHLFQVLDELLFGRLKSAKRYLARDDNLNPHMNHTFRVFRAHEITTTSTTVRSSWEKDRFRICETRWDQLFMGWWRKNSGESGICGGLASRLPRGAIVTAKATTKAGIFKSGSTPHRICWHGPRVDFTQ
jgi:hypothetical protein